MSFIINSTYKSTKLYRFFNQKPLHYLYSYIQLLSIIIISLFITTSCEKVIDVDLKDNSGQYVIEGEITDQSPPYFVKITRSGAFSHTGSFEGINSAFVTITDNTGIIDTLQLDSNGRYRTVHTIGEAGRTYTLFVNIDGKVFVSASTMPGKVNLDTLVTVDGSGFSSSALIVPVYRDASGILNYYRIKAFRNGNQTDVITVRDDELVDGDNITQPLFEITETGETWTIRFMNIDKPVYTYFYSLNQSASAGPDASATPANPISNVTGGCLGYFSAHTLQERSLTIP